MQKIHRVFLKDINKRGQAEESVKELNKLFEEGYNVKQTTTWSDVADYILEK